MKLLQRIAITIAAEQWSTLLPKLRDAIPEAGRIPMPFLAVDLLIIAEDRRFKVHPGFDVRGILRAVWRRLSDGRREGASTIAQQLVRTITNDRAPTIRRKLNEILLAVLVTAHFSHEQIARTYLYLAYYGWRMNGIKEAMVQLNLNAIEMTALESAALIARLKYPEPQVCPIARRRLIQFRAHHLIRLRQERQGIGWLSKYSYGTI